MALRRACAPLRRALAGGARDAQAAASSACGGVAGSRGGAVRGAHDDAHSTVGALLVCTAAQAVSVRVRMQTCVEEPTQHVQLPHRAR
jgi:hypothetical protein